MISRKRNNILLLVLFIVSTVLFYFIAKVAVHSHDNGFDRQILAFRNSIVSPALIRVMRAITFLGDRKFLFPAYCLLAVYLLLQKKYIVAAIAVYIGISAHFLQAVLKTSFHLGRPALPEILLPGDYGFPSGHAISSIVLGGILIYLTGNSSLRPVLKALIIIFISLLVLAIGFSRIILNVHYGTDVVGGFLVGFIWLIFWYVLFKRFFE